MPTACVCSGSGLHLIYFLDRPYQIQDEYQKQQWDNFRNKFTQRVWNKYVTKAAIQFENHCQSFRVVGTRTKKDKLVEAFWLSKKRYTLDDLFSIIPYEKEPFTQKKGERESDFWNRWFNAHFRPDDLMKVEKEPMPKLHQADRPLSPKLQEAKEKWPEWYQARIVEQLIGANGSHQAKENRCANFGQKQDNGQQERQQCHRGKSSGLHYYTPPKRRLRL